MRKKLGNANFVSKAPEPVVEKERDREARLLERCAVLERGVDRLREVDSGPCRSLLLPRRPAGSVPKYLEVAHWYS